MEIAVMNGKINLIFFFLLYFGYMKEEKISLKKVSYYRFFISGI